MQSQQLIGGNFVLGKAGLTGLSGAATTYSIGTAIVFALAGKALSKATAAGAATPTTDFVTGNPITVVAGKGTAVLWCLDAAGTVRAVQGSTELLDAANNFQFAAPQFPSVPDTLVPFAYSIHKGGNVPGALLAGTWTFGVSNWNTANTFHTVNDLIAIPNRPQIA